MRARSAASFARSVASLPERPCRILDLGAGNGWLSHRLAAAGHEPVALDVFDDEADGLAACGHYAAQFCAVQADFDALPFAPAQFDAVVFNASLHYASNPVEALAAARRMLREGGLMAVLDSPMFAAEADGARMVAEQDEAIRVRFGFRDVARPGRGFLTFADLDTAASRLFLRGRFVRSRGPLAWEIRRALSRRRIGRAPATFGAWIAR